MRSQGLTTTFADQTLELLQQPDSTSTYMSSVEYTMNTHIIQSIQPRSPLAHAYPIQRNASLLSTQNHLIQILSIHLYIYTPSPSLLHHLPPFPSFNPPPPPITHTLPLPFPTLFLFFLITLPLPIEEADPVLDRVDGVADDAEDGEEADYDYGDDEVAFYHCWGWWCAVGVR